MRRLCRSVALILLVMSAAGAPRASGTDQPQNPAGALTIPLDQVRWTKINDGTGRETATLFGDRSRRELFGYMIRWPPNAIFKAHSHPETRYTMVVLGTFYHGYGRTFDPSHLERRTTGTFFAEPAGVAHFGATKDEATILYFVGMGPDSTDMLDR